MLPPDPVLPRYNSVHITVDDAMGHERKSIKLLTVSCCLASLLFLLWLADYFLYPIIVSPGKGSFNSGLNGLWLGSKWYMGAVSEKDYISIAKLLKDEQIQFAYFHCKDIDKEGKLRIPSESGARKLVERMHSLCPGKKILVWIGALGTGAINGEVNVSNESVRRKMADVTTGLVKSAGFDGMQWDCEPTANNDESFIDLLNLTRQKLPANSILSVAADGNWSADYIQEMSKHCDQLALMDYNTGKYLPRDYVASTESLVTKFSNSIVASSSKCKLIVGVPTYDDVVILHHQPAENMRMAIVGVKAALSNPSCHGYPIIGIAPYAEWTTTDEEWRTYDLYWLGLHHKSN